VAAYDVVWECVVEQWLGVRRTTCFGVNAPSAGSLKVVSAKVMN